MPPTRLIYVSVRLDRTAEGLDAIFEASRRNNLRDDINGALIVSDSYFVQLLEGSYVAVSQCMERIMQDSRHTGVEVMSTKQAAYRLFPQWSMHRIDVAHIQEWSLKPFLIDGAFQPMLMSQMDIQSLCRMLSQRSSHLAGSAAAE